MMCNTSESLLRLFMLGSRNASFFESLNWKLIAISPVVCSLFHSIILFQANE